MRNRKKYIISLLVVIIFIAGIVSFEKEIRQSASGLFMAGFFTILSPLTIKRIEFHAKIIDQYGNSVEGVVVDYIGSKSILASGSGPGKTTTDSDGRFLIKDAKGESLVINSINKSSYQFPEVDRFYMPRGGEQKERFWSDYDKNNPFIINAWKVDQLSNVAHESSVFEVRSLQEDIIIRFDDGGITSGADLDGHITLNLTKRRLRYADTRAKWKLELKSKHGGFLETEDYFLYEAPEMQYQSNIIIQDEDSNWKKVRLYFKSDSGNSYGSFELEIRPGSISENAFLYFTYTINLDGDRSLVVPKSFNDSRI